MDVVRSTTVESSMSIEHRGEPVLNAQSRQAAPRLESSRPAQSGPVPRRVGGAGAGSPVAHPRRWLMLPVVLMAMFMAGFDI
jgi:hypothetical protein